MEGLVSTAPPEGTRDVRVDRRSFGHPYKGMVKKYRREIERLDPVAERALIADAQDGDLKAVARLIQLHQPLANSIAKRYTDHSVFGLNPDPDLVATAIEGMYDAIPRFDLTNPVRFATYAQFWMRSRIQAYVALNKTTISVGYNIRYRARKYREAVANLLREKPHLSYDVAIETVAIQLGIPTERFRGFITDVAVVSMETPVSTVGGDSDNLIRDTLLDQITPLPDVAAERHEAQDILKTVLDKLSPRQRYVIKRRYFETPPWTLELISRDWKVSRERIRQIEQAGLQRLRYLLAREKVRSLDDIL